jgi:diacylglycerol O-acyltransferase
VLVATVAGALRRYMIERGDDVEMGDIRALVPVNLRPPNERPTLGNEFSLVYLELPVSIASPRERVMAVKQRMDLLKRSPEPVLVYQVLRVLGMLPGGAAKEATDWFSTKASCVLTNVPGPRKLLYFAGKPLRRIMFWVPQSGNIAVGISVISYAGDVTLGLMVDEARVGDPRRIIEAFHDEFAMLRELAGREGAGGKQEPS